MEAVVLAGGLGTRLRAVVPDLPKPMAPVAGRPFLEILLSSLARKGVRRVLLSLGYKANVIVDHFGSRFGDMDLVPVVETSPLGTGGALRQALAHCQGPAALVVNGDTFLDVDVAAAWRCWQDADAPVIVGKAVTDAHRFGRLTVEADRLKGFADKGLAGPAIINTGHYVLPRTLFDGCGLHDPFSFEADFLAPKVDALSMRVYQTSGVFIDIGVPEDYELAQTLLAGL